MIRKLKEGAEYEFRVDKKFTDPSGTDYFVLSGPDGKRYLLPEHTYRHYRIGLQTIIKCRIDKINCRGEIFLEPEHPYYKAGNSYEFRVTTHDVRTDSSGREVNVYLVEDIFKNLITVPCNRKPATGTIKRLLVERISKGRVYLNHEVSQGKKDLLVTGRIYEFVIVKTARGMDNEEYYILKDKYGDIHSIPKDYYSYYGFRQGDKIRCKIMKFKGYNGRIIEPVNPYYRTGQFIRCTITGYTHNTINDTFTLILRDKSGFEHCIQTKALPEKESIRCRVKMIRKGKPLLIPM